jgi:hypothetical protein
VVLGALSVPRGCLSRRGKIGRRIRCGGYRFLVYGKVGKVRRRKKGGRESRETNGFVRSGLLMVMMMMMMRGCEVLVRR